MSREYDNENRGAVWPNKKRQKDSHPHWTGSANIDGVDYWVSVWKKKDDASEKAPSLSFSFKPKDDDRHSTQEPRRDPPADFHDDDIPF